MNKRQEKIKGIFNTKSFDANNEFDSLFSQNDSDFEYKNLIEAVKKHTSMKLSCSIHDNIIHIDEVPFVIHYNERLDTYCLIFQSETIHAKRS